MPLRKRTLSTMGSISPSDAIAADRMAPTGIKVIVVGAGFGGLGAAIECHRQGHDVEIYEAFPELKTLGDIISFMPNAGRIFARWGAGEVTRRMRPLSIAHKGFNIRKYDTGEVAYHQLANEYSAEAPTVNGHRGELHEVVFEYARTDLGIPIHLGNRIEEYFEDEAKAGIVLADGRRVSASADPRLRRYTRSANFDHSTDRGRRRDRVRRCSLKSETDRTGL